MGIPLAAECLEWFLSRAVIFDGIDMEKSLRLSGQSRMKECYKNCAILSARRGLVYHEGFASIMERDDGSPIWTGHAFLASDGRAVDPTMAIGNRLRDSFSYVGIPIPDAILRMARKGLFTDLLPDLYSEGRRDDSHVPPAMREHAGLEGRQKRR